MTKIELARKKRELKAAKKEGFIAGARAGVGKAKRVVGALKVSGPKKRGKKSGAPKAAKKTAGKKRGKKGGPNATSGPVIGGVSIN